MSTMSKGCAAMQHNSNPIQTHIHPQWPIGASPMSYDDQVRKYGGASGKTRSLENLQGMSQQLHRQRSISYWYPLSGLKQTEYTAPKMQPIGLSN